MKTLILQAVLRAESGQLAEVLRTGGHLPRDGDFYPGD